MVRWSRLSVAVAAAWVALLATMPAGRAWGADGHRVIALLADRALQQSDPRGHAKILALLAFPTRAGKDQTEPCSTIVLYKVGPDYETRALAAIRQQLAEAGVRLARMLRDNIK